MPIISSSNKKGRSADSSDWLTKKKKQVLQASYGSRYYNQIENKSFGFDTFSNLLRKNCAEVCNISN